MAEVTSFEPKPSLCPSSAVILGQFYQWGVGNISVGVFDFYSELWKIISTHGTPPLGFLSASSAGSEDYLYTYGGMAGDKSFNGCLHRLDTKTSTWSQLAAHSADSPMKKFLSGMIAYKKWVIVIGGTGIPHGPLQPGSKWIQCDDGCGDGVTNEMHKFDLSKGRNKKWFELKISFVWWMSWPTNIMYKCKNNVVIFITWFCHQLHIISWQLVGNSHFDI